MLEQYFSNIFEKAGSLDSIFGKWVVLLLVSIYFYESVNFSQLNKELRKITPKVLSNKLKHLEAIGLIGKKILLEHPLRVEYYITQKGEKFVEGIINTFKKELFIPNKE